MLVGFGNKDAHVLLFCSSLAGKKMEGAKQKRLNDVYFSSGGVGWKVGCFDGTPLLCVMGRGAERYILAFVVGGGGRGTCRVNHSLKRCRLLPRPSHLPILSLGAGQR